MDTKSKYRALYCRTVPASWAAPIELLLLSSISNKARSNAHESSRRDLYRETLLWFSKNPASSSKRRTSCQSQAHPRDNEKAQSRWKSTRSKHFKISSTTCQIPLSSKRLFNRWPPASMEHRYHIYSLKKRFCLSCGCNGLVQSTCTLPSSFKQFRNGFLLGRFRRGDSNTWETGNFQYGSRSTVYIRRICEGSIEQKYSPEHGRKRKSARQYFCRASLEIGKV